VVQFFCLLKCYLMELFHLHKCVRCQISQRVIHYEKQWLRSFIPCCRVICQKFLIDSRQLWRQINLRETWILLKKTRDFAYQLRHCIPHSLGGILEKRGILI
jgi:hypothetical protein